MPNNEMDYSLIHRTPDGNGKILVTTPGSPDKGSWETEAELKTYVNQDTVMKTDIVQSLGQQIDKVPSNKAVDDAINAISSINGTILGEGFIYVSPQSLPSYTLKKGNSYLLVCTEWGAGAWVVLIVGSLTTQFKTITLSNDSDVTNYVGFSISGTTLSFSAIQPSGWSTEFALIKL